jgi:hypothetical protein
MGIDIGGAFAIGGVSGTVALDISAGATDLLTIDTTGRTAYPNQIGFIAGLSGTDPGWVAQAAGWNIQNYWNAVTYNKGGGFAAGRFTAPVAGSYLFHWSGSQYKAGTAAGNYSHPQFWVNGAGVPTAYRMKAYFTPAGGYWNSANEIVDIYYLNAGDYVDMNVYCSVAGFSIYRGYSIFAGFLVG